jgi:membrane-bound lytic murein transglycosylase F
LLLCLALSPTSWGASLRDTTWDSLFQRYGELYLPEYHWHWIKAQSWQESRFKPNAVSPVGATGLMQIMPGTGRDLARKTGVRGPLTSPSVSVLYGAVYMRSRIRVWTSPRPPVARLELALASYNAGAGHIISAQRHADGALLWEDIAPHLHKVTGHHSRETLGYVRLIKQWKEDIDEHTRSDCVGRGLGPGEN